MSNGLNEIFGYPTGATVKAFTGTAAEQALSKERTYRFVATEDCHVSFIEVGGTAATTSNCLLKSGVPEIFSLNGDINAVSVISAGTSGNLHFNEMYAGSVG